MYAVFRSSRVFDDYSTDWEPVRHYQHSTNTENYDDALIYAEILAADHAKRIDRPYSKSGALNGKHAGYTFRTNNGSDVWYTVLPISGE